MTSKAAMLYRTGTALKDQYGTETVGWSPPLRRRARYHGRYSMPRCGHKACTKSAFDWELKACDPELTLQRDQLEAWMLVLAEASVAERRWLQ